MCTNAQYSASLGDQTLACGQAIVDSKLAETRQQQVVKHDFGLQQSRAVACADCQSSTPTKQQEVHTHVKISAQTNTSDGTWCERARFARRGQDSFHLTVSTIMLLLFSAGYASLEMYLATQAGHDDNSGIPVQCGFSIKTKDHQSCAITLPAAA